MWLSLVHKIGLLVFFGASNISFLELIPDYCMETTSKITFKNHRDEVPQGAQRASGLVEEGLLMVAVLCLELFDVGLDSGQRSTLV